MKRLGHRIRTTIAAILVVVIAIGLGGSPAAAMPTAPCQMHGHIAAASPAASMSDGGSPHLPAAVPPCCTLGMCFLMSAPPPVPLMSVGAKLSTRFALADNHVPAGLDLLPALPPPRLLV